MSVTNKKGSSNIPTLIFRRVLIKCSQKRCLWEKPENYLHHNNPKHVGNKKIRLSINRLFKKKCFMNKHFTKISGNNLFT